MCPGDGTTRQHPPRNSHARNREQPIDFGVLVDTTPCTGCRKCEEACNRRNHALYSLVRIGAFQATAQTVEEVRRVQAAPPALAAPVAGMRYPQRPEAYKSYSLLSSPVLNAASDDYEPMLFAPASTTGWAFRPRL